MFDRNLVVIYMPKLYAGCVYANVILHYDRLLPWLRNILSLDKIILQRNSAFKCIYDI